VDDPQCAAWVGSVYERGVAAVPYSVDLWSHYCAFAIQQRHDGDTVRGLFERGLAYVGTDWMVGALSIYYNEG
jgi:pre-mRNA-processing factor 39